MRLQGSASSVINITLIGRGTFTYVVIMNQQHLLSKCRATATGTLNGEHAWQHYGAAGTSPTCRPYTYTLLYILPSSAHCDLIACPQTTQLIAISNTFPTPCKHSKVRRLSTLHSHRLSACQSCTHLTTFTRLLVQLPSQVLRPFCNLIFSTSIVLTRSADCTQPVHSC